MLNQINKKINNYLLLIFLIIIYSSFSHDIIMADDKQWNIKGQLINGTTNSVVNDHLVILHVSADEDMQEYSVISDQNGFFYFNSLNHSRESIIGISSIFEGVLYGKDLGLISNQNDEIILTVYKSSDNS